MKKLSHLFLSFLFIFFGLFGVVENGYGNETTYMFTSKSWAAKPANWTSGKDGNQLTSGQGVQITTGTSGANAISPKSFSGVSSVIVTYCTNDAKGAGTIKIKIGSGIEKSFSVVKPSSGGTTLKTTTFNFSPTESGNVKIIVNCTANSIYIYSITIVEGSSTYNVIYNANGGSGSVIDNTNYTPNSIVTCKENSFFKTGYIFDCWVKNNTEIDEFSTFTITKNDTLYAKWLRDVHNNDCLFKEEWSETLGTGGNDGSWSGNIATSVVNSDSVGWTDSKVSGGNKCIKIGTSKEGGYISTPLISNQKNNILELVFKCASWGIDSANVKLDCDSAKLSLTSINPPNSKWVVYAVQISNIIGDFVITWKTDVKNKRFFLDSVCISSLETPIEIITWNKDSIFLSQDYFNEIDFEPTNIRVKNLGINVNKKTSLDERTDGTLHAEIKRLDTLECQTLNFIASNATSGLEYQIKVPIFAGTNHIIDNEDCDVVILKDSIFTPSDSIENKDVMIYPNGVLKIPEGATYKVNSLTLRRDNDDVPSLSYNGTLNITNGIIFQMRTNSNDWRWLTLSTSLDTRFANDYPEIIIKYYNGAHRASNGSGGWQEVGTWKHYDRTFNAGQGVIFGIDTIENVKLMYNIPLNKEDVLTSEKDHESKSVQVYPYGKGTTAPPNDLGWNVIGNPYMDSCFISSSTPIRYGLLKKINPENWNGQWEIDSIDDKHVKYIVVKDTNEQYASANYYKVIPLQTGIKLPPFISFFIQVDTTILEEGSAVIFSRTSGEGAAMMHARTKQISEETFLQLNVNNKQTGCFISNKYNDEYEINADLESFDNQLYQTINGYKLIYSAINDSIIEHGINVFGYGEVSLNDITDINSFEEINIFYNEHWYDLLNGDTPNVQGNFILFAKRSKNDILTGLNEIIINGGIKKFIHNGNVYIIKENEVYNILGEKIR